MIKLTNQPAPTIPKSVSEEITELHPNVLLRWNSKKHGYENGTFAGRWEVWIKLVENTHSLNRHSISKKDLFQDGCIYRFLQTWCYVEDVDSDLGFCPLDGRILQSLRLADTFRNRRFYEDVYENFEYNKELQRKKDIRTLAANATSEYYGLDNPIIGRYTKGDWRHRIR